MVLNPRMKQTDPQFKLRIPAELKSALEAAATTNKRSITAEVVARLEESFRQTDTPTTPALLMLRKLHEESAARLAELRAIRKPTAMEQVELEHEERAAKNLRHTIARSLQFLTDSFPQKDDPETAEEIELGVIDYELHRATPSPTAKRPLRKTSRPLGMDQAEWEARKAAENKDN